jgi:hypothetical protein
MIAPRCLRWLVILGIMVSSAGAVAQDPHPGLTGLHEVAFDEDSPLARTPDFLRRVLSPLAAESLRRRLEITGRSMAEQSLDVARERFVTYAPARVPPHGYALLVFVPPWPEAKLPPGWGPVLDRFGMIYVSAARSGNAENILTRREPLALIEAQNIVHRYPVDPDRIYVGGMSGGSRIALRLALDFPDVFRGGLLNAGSDPVGVSPIALPAKDLLKRFQESSRLVYVTGSQDTLNLSMDAASTRSMRRFCVSNLEAEVTPWVDHDVVSPEALARALESLLKAARTDPGHLSACRAAVELGLKAKLQRAESALAAGRRDDARRLILDIDASLGGLAVPWIIELADRCDCGILPKS